MVVSFGRSVTATLSETVMGVASGFLRPPVVVAVDGSSSIVNALKGFDTSAKGTGDEGAFGIVSLITTTLDKGRVLRCGIGIPVGHPLMLCYSARRDEFRYRELVSEICGLVGCPAARIRRGLGFVSLERCPAGRHVDVVRCTLSGCTNGVYLIVVSKVESLICSVGGTARTARVANGLVG